MLDTAGDLHTRHGMNITMQWLIAHDPCWPSQLPSPHCIFPVTNNLYWTELNHYNAKHTHDFKNALQSQQYLHMQTTRYAEVFAHLVCGFVWLSSPSPSTVPSPSHTIIYYCCYICPRKKRKCKKKKKDHHNKQSLVRYVSYSLPVRLRRRKNTSRAMVRK